MKATYKELFKVAKIADGLANLDDKLGYACRKFLKKFDKINEEIQEEFNDLRLEYCSTDKDGNVIRDSKGGYVFTKENEKKYSTKVKEVRSKEFEFDPYFATEVPADIPPTIKEALEGFIIKMEGGE